MSHVRVTLNYISRHTICPGVCMKKCLSKLNREQYSTLCTSTVFYLSLCNLKVDPWESSGLCLVFNPFPCMGKQLFVNVTSRSYISEVTLGFPYWQCFNLILTVVETGVSKKRKSFYLFGRLLSHFVRKDLWLIYEKSELEWNVAYTRKLMDQFMQKVTHTQCFNHTFHPTLTTISSQNNCENICYTLVTLKTTSN